MQTDINYWINKEVEETLVSFLDGKGTGQISDQEIFGIAKKIKNSKLIEQGDMQNIGILAEEEYRRVLSTIDQNLYNEYLKAKSGEFDRERAHGVYDRCNESLPDVEFKKRFIQKRLDVDLLDDKDLIRESIKNIITKKLDQKLKRINKLLLSVSPISRSEDAENFLDFYLTLIEENNGILYEKEFERLLIKGFVDSGHFLMYKCLRFTHDDGFFSFCSNLDDCAAKDKFGNTSLFFGRSELKQIEKIILISRLLQDHNFEFKLLIADGDLLKYGSMVTIDHKKQVDDYKNCLRSRLGSDIEVYLETETFDSNEDYLTIEERIKKSIRTNGFGCMPHEEFSRIIQNYHDTFSKVFHNWDISRSHEYSVISVARNIAQGIYISENYHNPILGFFNIPDVNGYRFNLGLKNKKIPVVGYKKLKTKNGQAP